MAKRTKINLEDLRAELRGQTVAGGNASDPALQIGSLVSMQHLEEAHLRKVLERTSNLAEVADLDRHPLLEDVTHKPKLLLRAGCFNLKAAVEQRRRDDAKVEKQGHPSPFTKAGRSHLADALKRSIDLPVPRIFFAPLRLRCSDTIAELRFKESITPFTPSVP